MLHPPNAVPFSPRRGRVFFHLERRTLPVCLHVKENTVSRVTESICRSTSRTCLQSFAGRIFTQVTDSIVIAIEGTEAFSFGSSRPSGPDCL